MAFLATQNKLPCLCAPPPTPVCCPTSPAPKSLDGTNAARIPVGWADKADGAPMPPRLAPSGGKVDPLNGLNPVGWGCCAGAGAGAELLKDEKDEPGPAPPSSPASWLPKAEVGWNARTEEPPNPVGWDESGAGVEAEKEELENEEPPKGAPALLAVELTERVEKALVGALV